MFSELVVLFKEGGLFLYPILIVFAVGIAISIERWIYLTRELRRNAKTFDDFLPLLRVNDVDKMRLFTRDHSAPVARIIGCGIDMMKASRLRADIENAMGEGLAETMPRLEARTGYLSVLANMATLLGLLGTIIGLIMAFSAVADADPAEKSRLLSQSISVAMYTTAFGLIAAIPLLLFHALLQNKTAAIVNSIEMGAAKFLNVMVLNHEIEVGIAAPAVTPRIAAKHGQEPAPVNQTLINRASNNQTTMNGAPMNHAQQQDLEARKAELLEARKAELLEARKAELLEARKAELLEAKKAQLIAAKKAQLQAAKQAQMKAAQRTPETNL